MSATSLISERCPWCGSPIPHERFVEIEARIRDEEKQRLEAQRLDLEAQFRRDLSAQIEGVQRKAREQAELRLADLEKERDAAVERAGVIERATEKAISVAVEAEVAKVRDILEREREAALLKKDAEAARDREALLKRLSELQRRVDKRTSNELGDGAELDLYETLRELLPEDRTTRIGKGQPGADIQIEVLDRGKACGTILIDSKNRKAWQTAFATKLREDQVASGADHAILSTTAFPSGKKEICIEAGVIVASPARVPQLVQILRTEAVKLHRLGVSNERRHGKREALYQYVTSEDFRQKLEEVKRLTDEILDLDVKEQRQHQNTWEKRGGLVRQQQRALGEVDVEITAIVSGDPETELEN